MIKRWCYEKIKKHAFEAKEVTMVIGPRQSGKTTLLRQLMDEMIRDGRKVMYLNLDYEADNQFFESQITLIAKIKNDIGSAGTVFIDEVQRKENAGVFLKGIYDMDLGYKFVVTGSGSFELNEKIVESMAGRKRLFELNSLSFKEFVDYKTDYKYVENYDLLQKFEEDKLSLMLQEYLIFGGYPRVILSSDEAEKRLLATEIFNSYLDKDIRGWLGVDKIQEFTEMCRVLAAESGQLLDMTKLGKQTALSYKTIKNYLWYLEKTYIIRTVRPFGKNKVNELVRSPMVYFNDLGMRNFLLGQLYQRDFKINLVDTSFLFQNLIFLMLIDLTEINLLPYDICYWRTKSGAEVDFVWGNIVKPIPVEVKFSKQKNVTRSLMSFMNKYMPEKAFLVNLEVEKKYRGVDFVPYWRLMEKNFLG